MKPHIHAPRFALTLPALASELRIVPFRLEMLPAVARLLARAFVTSPTHIAAFGTFDLARTEAFYYARLAGLDGPGVVALQGTQAVGFAHWTPGPQSDGHRSARALVADAVARSADAATAERVTLWLDAWHAHTPPQPHAYVGPLAVEPSMRGLGIGSALLAHVCAQTDRAGLPAYVETDRLFQVAFLRHFGFYAVQELDVLDRRHWLMARPLSRA